MRDAFHAAQVERDARMDAAVAEMAVEGRLVAAGIHQRLEFAQVVAKAQRIHRRILPAHHGVGTAPGFARIERKRGGRCARFADRPHAFDRRLVFEEPGTRLRVPSGDRLDECARLRRCGFLGVPAELDHQPRSALGEQADVVQLEAALAQAADDLLVESFAGDRAGLEDDRDDIACGVDVREPEDQHHSRGRVLHQPGLRLQRDRARAFGPDQRAGDVEPVLRQQLVEVIAGHAAFDLREFRADQPCILVAQRLEPCIDFTLPATRGNDRLEFRIGGGAGPEPRAVRRDDFQRLDVFHRLAGHHGVRSARIVADHAAQRAATVRGGIRPEGQSVLFGSRLQRIAHRAGLDERRAPRWVDRDDIAHVLGEIQHHGHVHALPALRGAAATRQQRRTVLAADAQGGDHVVRRPGEHHADRDLAVVRGVRAVDRAAAGIEAHLARNGRGKCGGKGFGLLGTKRGLGCDAHGGPHSSR